MVYGALGGRWDDRGTLRQMSKRKRCCSERPRRCQSINNLPADGTKLLRCSPSRVDGSSSNPVPGLIGQTANQGSLQVDAEAFELEVLFACNLHVA